MNRIQGWRTVRECCNHALERGGLPVVVARVADDLRDAERERVGLVVPLEVVIPENHAEITHGAPQSTSVGTPTKQTVCCQELTVACFQLTTHPQHIKPLDGSF